MSDLKLQTITELNFSECNAAALYNLRYIYEEIKGKLIDNIELNNRNKDTIMFKQFKAKSQGFKSVEEMYKNEVEKIEFITMNCEKEIERCDVIIQYIKDILKEKNMFFKED